MVNPFKPGDKVLILRKGIELDATVRSTFNHEVQVRLADGELLWRTVKTARLVVESAPAEGPQPGPHASPAAPDAPTPEPALNVGNPPVTAEVTEQADEEPKPSEQSPKAKRRKRQPRNR